MNTVLFDNQNVLIGFIHFINTYFIKYDKINSIFYYLSITMLSPRKVNRCSPSKENASPSRNLGDTKMDIKSPSLEVLMSAISELQSLVVRNGGQVP